MASANSPTAPHTTGRSEDVGCTPAIHGARNNLIRSMPSGPSEGLLMSVEPASLEASPSGPIPIVSSVHALGSRPFSQRVWKAVREPWSILIPWFKRLPFESVNPCLLLPIKGRRHDEAISRNRLACFRRCLVSNHPDPGQPACSGQQSLHGRTGSLRHPNIGYSGKLLISGLEGFERDFITQLNESKDLPSSSYGSSASFEAQGGQRDPVQWSRSGPSDQTPQADRSDLMEMMRMLLIGWPGPLLPCTLPRPQIVDPIALSNQKG